MKALTCSVVKNTLFNNSQRFMLLKATWPLGKTPSSPTNTDMLGPYRGLVLMQHLVISTQSHAENDGRHIFKTVDPFLPF